MAQATLVRPNPVLTRGFAQVRPVMADTPTMTLQGTVNKTIALTGLLLIGGAVGWPLATTNAGGGIFIVALIAAAILGLVTSFRPQSARITAPIYSILEGFVLGAISELLNKQYPGVVITAVEITVGLLIGMLVLYRTGIVKVTQKFRMAVAAATFAVFAVFLANLVVSAFGGSIGFVNGNSAVAIGFTLLVIAIGCANLIVDFDFIQRGVAARYPKSMEWYGAFSIIVTLVWLYIEVLRLLSQLNRR